MKTNIIIKALLQLTSLAEEKITSWPLKDKIRVSFWCKDSPQKMFPCEIQDSGKFDNIGIKHEVLIMLPIEAEEILFEKAIFYIGLNRDIIGEGQIINID